MKIRHALTVIVTAFLIWGSGSTPVAIAQALPEHPLKVLSSDEQGIVLELTVADFQVETVEDEGQTFHRLIIPGMAQTDTPGAPQVPTRGALLGLPGLTDISVQVLEASYETLRGYRLPPGPSIEIATDSLEALPSGDFQLAFAPNRELYGTDAFYPGQPVALGTTGYLRDQAVAQVQFYPVQYNPVIGEVHLYRRIRARVTWNVPLSLAATEEREASPAFEHVLQDTILNYDALERPPVPDGVPSFGPTPPTPFSLLPAPYSTSTSSSANTLKIGVTEDGLYALTYSDLTGVGFDLSGVDPRAIKISHRGTEIPIHVEGEADGVFDPTDAVLFYGTAITDVYTVKNVYWLKAGGSAGQRMATWDGTPSGATVPTDFPTTVHAEEDTYYWVTMPDGEGQDHWFWGDQLSPNTQDMPTLRDYALALDHISTEPSTATVRVRLKGVTGLGHRTRIYLNGHQIDDQSWSGQIVYDHEVTTVPHLYLRDGSNTVRVEAADSGDPLPHQVLVNWIEIDYWDTYTAEDDQLLFGPPEDGTFQFEATNFSDNEVQVYNVTVPTNVAVITDTIVVADGGSHTLRFEDTAQPATRYLALTPPQRKSPASVELDEPSTWKDPANRADYVIITHEEFYASALRLASHRSAAGLRVATVKVKDVYDEFNGGIFNPQAIRDFLVYAYDHWVKPAPTHVLLLGGASYDYRDLLGLSRDNYVPTQMIETEPLGQTPSDNWFVLVSGGDILPDMSIGRLTAQTASEAEHMVDKIIAYEQNPPAGSWNTGVLLVADDDEPAFETLSDELADLLPHYYTATKVYVDDYPPGDPTVDIAGAINGGSVLVNYAGHGNVDMWGVWSGGRTFDRSPDVTLLNNTHRLPVVTVGTCLNGYFAGKNTSTAEEFLRLQDRGAVAVWADAGMGYPANHRALLGSLYEGIFQDDQHESGLGAVTWAAKIAAFNQPGSCGELVQTFTLFGDPVTQLGIPANYPYVESTTPVNGATDVPLDQGIQIVFSKPMSPTTVLLSGPGTTEAVFAPPTWSAGDTVLNYTHTGFDYNQTLAFTISGQDRPGNPLGPGPVPSTWSFTTPFAPTGVPISGPAAGVVHTSYTFNATVSPSIAAQPVTYVWEATGQSPVTHTGLGLNDAVSFHWDTPGTKTITVTASNVAGSATETHDVTIYVPSASVEITGPAMGAIDTAVTFNASVSPGMTTQPITYVWEATDQPPMTHPGGGLDDAVTFNWDTPGTKTITVTASNAGGTAQNNYSVAVGKLSRHTVYLPLVIRDD